MFSKAACQICGVELHDPRDRLMLVCRAARCQLEWSSRLQARQKAELQRRKLLRTRIAEVHRNGEAERLGLDGVELPHAVVVPANVRKLVNLPERRKRAFRDHLLRLICEASVLWAKKDASTKGETAADSTPLSSAWSSMLGRGCATCRGRCCTGGGNHAYLSVETILGYFQRNPKARPREVLEAYLVHLPNRAYEDSCVYHTEGGCALPREMRSRISGDFFCEELRSFERDQTVDEDRPVIFYAFEEQEIVRSEHLPTARTEIQEINANLVRGDVGLEKNPKKYATS
jgi:hypothetical protein